MNDPIIDRSDEQKKMRVEKLREELDALGYYVIKKAPDFDKPEWVK